MGQRHPRAAASGILLFLVASVLARPLDPALEKPVLFIVLDNVSQDVPTTVRATRGTSLRAAEGQFVSPRIPIGHPITHYAHMYTLVAVDTDNEAAMGHSIDQWMTRECMRIRGLTVEAKKDTKGHCYVWPSKCCSYSLPRIDTMTAETLAPESAVAVIPARCEDAASAALCRPPACRFFGQPHQCKPADFCGFKTQVACEQTGHCRYTYEKRSRRAKILEWRCVSKTHILL